MPIGPTAQGPIAQGPIAQWPIVGLLELLKVLNVLNVLKFLNVMNLLKMPKDQSLACWALFLKIRWHLPYLFKNKGVGADHLYQHHSPSSPLTLSPPIPSNHHHLNSLTKTISTALPKQYCRLDVYLTSSFTWDSAVPYSVCRKAQIASSL